MSAIFSNAGELVSAEEHAATLWEANLRIQELERQVKALREQMESAVEEVTQAISRDCDAVYNGWKVPFNHNETSLETLLALVEDTTDLRLQKQLQKMKAALQPVKRPFDDVKESAEVPKKVRKVTLRVSQA